MSFFAVILRNLVRQRIRTGLTLLGISVGITTVVALGAITGGFGQTAGQIIHTGGADFMVVQKGAADLSFSTVTEADWRSVAAEPGIELAIGESMHVTQVRGNPMFFAMGVRANQLRLLRPDVVDGRLLSAAGTRDVVLGQGAAQGLGVPVGGSVTISRTRLRVVGVYRSNNPWENNGAYVPLRTVQAMTGRPRSITTVYVKARPGTDPAALAARIERRFPQLTTISKVSQYGKVDQGIQLLDAADLAISMLAVGIGAIGVMNTMIMSVFERTREIGILRAVGWSRRRIMGMILSEAAMLCALATAIGIGLGLAATWAVTLEPTIGKVLQPSFGVGVVERALIVAAIVALVGAAYPAVRAIRLTPMEALRHE